MLANMKLNKDIALLKRIMTIGKFSGTCPRDKSKNTVYSVILIAIVYSIVWTSTGCVLMEVRRGHRWTTTFLSICMLLFTSMFHASNFTGSLRHGETWKKLLRNFSEMDAMSMFNFEGDTRVSYIKIWIFNCTFYVMQVACIFIYSQRFQSISVFQALSSLYSVFTLVMGQWLVVTMNHLSNVMLARYEHTQRMIRRVILEPQFFLVKKRLKAIQKIVCMMNDCITFVNSIFGGPLILLMVMTFVNILEIFDLTLNISNYSDGYVAIFYIYQCLTLTIFTIHIVHSCDKIEKSYERLLTNTNVLQMHVEDEATRDVLLALFDYMKKMRPKVSAAGFFQINQSLFSSFLTALVSYSIIVVQLETSNMS